MANAPRVGFIGWNPFQFLHIKRLAQAIEGACFIFEKRKEFISEFSSEILECEDIPIMIWDRAKMPSLDGVFDIIVCQTPFFRIEEFEKTKIAMIQYGYAKEPHNYGAWRSLADVCMTYGPYATQKISPFAPSVSVGNPRYDVWGSEEFHRHAKENHGSNLDPNKKTVLYLPTWGDLSSVDQFLDSVYSLSEEYNVILKMHHNTELLESERKKRVTDGAIVHYGTNDDLLVLLSVCDLVISDYSGAIFDAVYCKKPVVLLNTNLDEQLGGKKIDEYSLEYSRRNELGYVVNSPEELLSTVNVALTENNLQSKTSNELREELFLETNDATKIAVSVINGLHKNEYIPSQSQAYMRSEIKELLRTKRQLAIANKKLKEGK